MLTSSPGGASFLGALRLSADLKTLALVTLVVQNSALILTMRYSRVMNTPERYFTSTSVLMNEVLKIVICLCISAQNIGLSATYRSVFGPGHWKMALPAAMYTLQNSMQYVAASNLDAATLQVTYQLKILTTAFFSVTILHRRLSSKRWLALVTLTLGVAVVTTPGSLLRLLMEWAGLADTQAVGDAKPSVDSGNTVVGLVAVSIACFLSGMAGIYFEKILKESQKVSLWTRNLQLGFYSLFPAIFIGCGVKDGQMIREYGFFYGYNIVVVSVVLLQAAGGLVVALCVKYADNIAKNFATSISIVLSALASVYVFKTSLSFNFVLGATIVIGATLLYSSTSSTSGNTKPEDEEKLRSNSA